MQETQTHKINKDSAYTDKLIEVSKRAMESFFSTIHAVTNVTDYKGYTGWKELHSLEVGTVFQALAEDGSSIKNIVQHKDEFSIDFLTILEPGQSFELQWHDCAEDCVVKFGVLADKNNPDSYAKKRGFLHFPPWTKHHPYNPSEKLPTKIEVTFYNPHLDLEE